jgi:hypothetical protein
MTGTLGVDTVGGALRCAESGPAGVFGTVESRVLERTGQADLAFDGTLLAEASDAKEQGGDPTCLLALYGERHGAWVLHRRRLQPRKVRRPNDPALPPLYSCEVLVADNAEDLVALAGLGTAEKRLFQKADILPHETLAGYHAEKARKGAEAPPQAVDLGKVAARPRLQLLAIVALVREGKLNPVDLDLLLRLARQLSKPRR